MLVGEDAAVSAEDEAGAKATAPTPAARVFPFDGRLDLDYRGPYRFGDGYHRLRVSVQGLFVYLR